MEDLKPPEPGACDWFDMVRDFNEKFGHPTPDQIHPMYKERRRNRALWMAEEMIEFAMEDDIVGQVKEMLDVIYFAVGTLVEMGIDPRGLFDVVHESNMQKLWPDGKPRYDHNNKIIKPRTWMPAEHEINRIISQREKEQRQKDDIPF